MGASSIDKNGDVLVVDRAENTKSFRSQLSNNALKLIWAIEWVEKPPRSRLGSESGSSSIVSKAREAEMTKLEKITSSATIKKKWALQWWLLLKQSPLLHHSTNWARVRWRKWVLGGAGSRDEWDGWVEEIWVWENGGGVRRGRNEYLALRNPPEIWPKQRSESEKMVVKLESHDKCLTIAWK